MTREQANLRNDATKLSSSSSRLDQRLSVVYRPTKHSAIRVVSIRSSWLTMEHQISGSLRGGQRNKWRCLTSDHNTANATHRLAKKMVKVITQSPQTAFFPNAPKRPKLS